MTHEETLAAVLSQVVQAGADMAAPVCALTLRDVLAAVVRRFGTSALELSTKDLLAARNEVAAACEHHLNEQDCMEIGLEIWAIVRNLNDPYYPTTRSVPP